MELEPVHRLSSGTSVSQADSELWEQLFALQLPSSTAEEVAAASFAFCAEMVRNNPTSGNLQTLVQKLIDLLHLASSTKAADSKLAGMHVRQACCCVFLTRLFLKHMIETLPAEQVDAHLSIGSPTGSLAIPLVEALLTTLVRCEVSDETYWLHSATCMPERASQPSLARTRRHRRTCMPAPRRGPVPLLACYAVTIMPSELHSHTAPCLDPCQHGVSRIVPSLSPRPRRSGEHRRAHGLDEHAALHRLERWVTTAAPGGSADVGRARRGDACDTAAHARHRAAQPAGSAARPAAHPRFGCWIRPPPPLSRHPPAHLVPLLLFRRRRGPHSLASRPSVAPAAARHAARATGAARPG